MKNWKESSVYLTKSGPEARKRPRTYNSCCSDRFQIKKTGLRQFLCLLLLVNIIYPATARSNDSSGFFLNDIPQENEREFIPQKAAMYSAVLPGLGQVYNRKYWKLPIVYGGFAALTYWTVFNHNNYIRYQSALEIRTDGNPHRVDEFAGDPRFTEQVLTDYMEFYRRGRDRAIIWTAGFYALTIVDAVVDAYLYDFDVSEDLSLRVSPSILNHNPSQGYTSKGSLSVGLRCRIKF